MGEKILFNIDPEEFIMKAIKASELIKDKDDKVQFMDWARLFIENVTKVNDKNGSKTFEYWATSSIIFDGIDGETTILNSGEIMLSKGILSLDNVEDEFPTEKWTIMFTKNFPEILDLIAKEYNKDNRYLCRDHGTIRYISHDGIWTEK
jgi:hypothetical protein